MRKGGVKVQSKTLHVEILECLLVILIIGQLSKAVSWILSPLTNWLLASKRCGSD